MSIATSLLVLALAGPPPASAATCPRGVDEPGVQLGTASASVVVEAFIDPSSIQSLRTWMELRRIVADGRGRTRVEVRWVGTGSRRRPRVTRVRGFVAALADRGHTTAALRVVARDGAARLHARLIDPSAHDALAKELGVDVAVVQSAANDRCATRRVERDTARLRQRVSTESGAIQRLPTFFIGDFNIDDTPALDTVRTEVGRNGARLRRYEAPAPPSPPPPRPAISDRMERPDLAGVLLGGPGLPHRLVVMARDESDLALATGLPHALALRDTVPGQTAVHIVSRGVSAGAVRLRVRLCAARTLGLGPAYAEYLARDSVLRQTPDAADEALLEALDDVDPKTCEGDIDPVDLDLPDGTWLDGWPRSRGELGMLPNTLRMLDAANRPLDTILRPAERVE